VGGGRWNINNFPDRIRGNYRKPQSVSEKIKKLEHLAENINMPEVMFSFKDIFDRELRNAVFHSDYSLFKGEVRIKNPKRTYSNQEITDLFNKAVAHFVIISELIKVFIISYEKPRVIPIHPEFSSDPDERAITIIRKGHGLAGLKDNWTVDELKRGHISFKIGRFNRRERVMMDMDPLLTILPYDRTQRMNRILKLLPNFLRKSIVGKIESKI
jgi:hypothetical protein